SISKKTYSRNDFIKGPAVVQSDVLKIFQLLPSVTASSDFSSALYVRGGAPDQNLILFDNIPIFNPFHLGGIFSTFPVRAIETASFYAGGFDVTHGNRVSSVIDIKTLIPDDKRFAFNYDISMLSASAYIQAEPVKNLSFFINGRRTYFDKILELFDWDFPYYFYDITFKANYRIQQSSNIEFTWFIDRDIIDLVMEDTLELFDDVWGNSSYGLTFNHVFNNNSDMNISVYKSEYDNTINLLDIMKAHSGVKEKGIKGKYNITIKGLKIKNGFECYQNEFIYNLTRGDSDELFDINDKPMYYAGFIGIEWKKGDAFILNTGLRGEKYDYDRNIYFSPRAGLKFFIMDETAFSMNLGVYRQFITSVKQETNDFSSVFGEMYMPVYEQYDPQYLKQLTIGFEHWFDNSTTVSIECYKKEYENLVNSTMIDLILNMDDPKNA
ncbi:TonB-dependent receptor plug domain-containing protein, partial [candidate division WOR-3 bacterium]|nr:TonB-dependent receptor plug domain-containing protein [candidate division WOR-3 bacterium]